MRLWQNSDGAILTDDQVLAYISTHGSLSAALESGDIECISDSESTYLPLSFRSSIGKKKSLSDFLKENH